MGEDQTRIALFIDFENFFNGIGKGMKIGPFLKRLQEQGTVSIRRAYGDWFKFADYRIDLLQHGIEMIEQTSTTMSGKNGADIKMTIAAIETAYNHPEIQTFAIASGDIDFLALILKLREHGKRVIVLSSRKSSSQMLQENCDEFIACETVTATSAENAPIQIKGGERAQVLGPVIEGDLNKAISLLKKVIRLIEEGGRAMDLANIKNQMLKLDPAFDQKLYGYSSFVEFIDFLIQETNIPYKLEQKAEGVWILSPAQIESAVVLFKKVISIREEKGDEMDVAEQKNIMLRLDPTFDEKKLGYSRFKDFVEDVLDRFELPYHLQRNGQTIYVIAPGAQIKRDKAPIDAEETLPPQIDVNLVSPAEWKVIIETIKRCLADGEGKVMKGKLWIYSSYFYTARKLGGITFPQMYDKAVLKFLTEKGVLAQKNEDIFLLSLDNKEREAQFLNSLAG